MGVGELTQQLRTRATLTEDRGEFCSPVPMSASLQQPEALAPEDPMSPDVSRHLHSRMHLPTHEHIHVHITKNKTKSLRK